MFKVGLSKTFISLVTAPPSHNLYLSGNCYIYIKESQWQCGTAQDRTRTDPC